jgi:ATP-dependent protease HslVU (ClpYQ) peptidase subunit
MTAIAGLIHQGRVHLAGDSAATSGWDLSLKPDGKVFTTGPYALGFSGSLRAAQLVQYALELPAPDGDLPKFMATTFVNALRTCLKEGGHSKSDSERESVELNLLVGVHGRLFRIFGDYTIDEGSQPFAATGCGESFALGALHATANLGWKPKQRLKAALSAAEWFSAGVRGPYTYAATPKSSKS